MQQAQIFYKNPLVYFRTVPWMKKKGVDDALIQPYSGHDSRQSLEIYSKLSLGDCQPEYEKKIKDFPI